ncbi:hypothetical protein E3E36_02025 [Thermococcus sp. M36]|uniref:hypothetical protein n=1 Tax=Thermococcus sp. M36 TaxID=1638261 RepID=UPI00143CAE5E|nr:hypothetical protein [Thermococcus sp. M36]NJE04947.1 hypothetical protein [Thermococcus sp. M36]
MLLTRHAKERLVKRLTKRRKLGCIYSELWSFLDRSVRLDVGEGIVIFTDGRKSLVCTKLDCERLPLEEIRRRVAGTERSYECVFFDGRLVKETTPRKFIEEVPDGEYCFYINMKKRSLYIGSREPFLVITIRPAKGREREAYASSRGTTMMSPNGSS